MRLNRESKKSMKKLIQNTPTSFGKFRNANLISINMQSKAPAAIIGSGSCKSRVSKLQNKSPQDFEFEPSQKVTIFE